MSILKLYLCFVCSMISFAAGQRAQIYSSSPQGSYNRLHMNDYGHTQVHPAAYSQMGNSKLVGGRHHSVGGHHDATPMAAPVPVTIPIPQPRSAPPDKSCPNGFVLSKSGSGCVKVSRQIADVICPDGCEPDHQTLQCHCIEETELSFSCPPGFESDITTDMQGYSSHHHIDKYKKRSILDNDDNKSECVRMVQKPPMSRCDDPRMTLVGEECVARDAVAPELECQPEMHLSGDICVMKETLPARTECPAGYAPEDRYNRKLGIGIKESIIRVDKRRKYNENYSDSVTDNYEPTMRCISQRTQKASRSCPRGHRLERDSFCVLEIIEPVEMKCMEPGFSFDIMTKRCTKEVLSHPDQACKVGYIMEGGECVKSNEETPIPNCRDGFHFDITDGQCIKVLREPPRMTCPSRDYHYDGLSCVKKDKRMPTTRCETGHLDGDVCIEAIEGHTRQACPDGLQLDTVLQKCIGTRTKPVEYKCPPGTELINESECLIIDNVAPSLNCPESYFLIGDSCEKERVTQPQMKCIPPYQLLGGECLAERASRASLACDPGLTLDNGVCSVIDYAPGTMSCPPGFSVYKETCVRQNTMPAESMCPPGFVFDGLQCVGQEEVPPTLQCPDNFELSPTDAMCVELPLDVEAKVANIHTKKKIGRKQ